ncbi:MAG: manganese efflux pump MntP family protein [Fibrobacter sp.]|jgi:putative Mn2+ efflux pump MntP|nr:manganese efflux pump MntP family protein [Fibrobacter sp.]
MQTTTVLLIALSVSMDCFAVSIGTFLGKKQAYFHKMLQLAFAFGSFQALMTLLGFFTGEKAGVYVAKADHWIAFALLAFLGFKMIRESFGHEEHTQKPLTLKTILTLSVATSIDAFAIGISFALLNSPVLFPIAAIGIISFLVTLLGGFVGKISARESFGKRAETAGGIVLVLIGVKILAEHL